MYSNNHISEFFFFLSLVFLRELLNSAQKSSLQFALKVLSGYSNLGAWLGSFDPV